MFYIRCGTSDDVIQYSQLVEELILNPSDNNTSYINTLNHFHDDVILFACCSKTDEAIAFLRFSINHGIFNIKQQFCSSIVDDQESVKKDLNTTMFRLFTTHR